LQKASLETNGTTTSTRGEIVMRKKLRIHKETLRLLSRAQARRVKGGKDDGWLPPLEPIPKWTEWVYDECFRESIANKGWCD
jgi:hypothetical protein